MRNDDKRAVFLSELTDSHFTLQYISVLNEMLNGFEKIYPHKTNNSFGMSNLPDIIKNKIKNKKDALNKMQNGVTAEYNYLQLLKDIGEYSFTFFTNEFFEDFLDGVKKELEQFSSMDDISKFESKIDAFCSAEGILEYAEQMGDQENAEVYADK